MFSSVVDGAGTDADTSSSVNLADGVSAFSPTMGVGGGDPGFSCTAVDSVCVDTDSSAGVDVLGEDAGCLLAVDLFADGRGVSVVEDDFCSVAEVAG